MHYYFLKAWFLLALTMMLSACATTEVPKSMPAKKTTQEAALKPGDIFRTKDGKIVSFETLMDDLAKVQVIYAGEVHTSLEDHRIQLKILKALSDRNHVVMLAMEMFPRDEQPILDKFSKGRLSERKLVLETKWDKVWGYPFELYREILEFARERHIPVLGLNAPPSVVRKIGRLGISSLSPEERGRVASHFDLDDSRRRQFVKQEYDQHIKGDIANFESFYEAQLAWEETMSETLARRLGSLPDGGQILVMIGIGHISSGEGVPRYTSERINYSYSTIVPIPINEFEPKEDSKIADFIWITERSDHFHHGALGIMLHPSAEGLEIVHVSPGSNADRIGLKKGDIIYMMDGTAVSTVEELHKAMTQRATVHWLSIKRAGESITFTIPR